MYMSVSVYMCTYVNTCYIHIIYIYVCMYVYICMCTCVCARVCIWACMYMYTCVCKYIHSVCLLCPDETCTSTANREAQNTALCHRTQTALFFWKPHGGAHSPPTQGAPVHQPSEPLWKNSPEEAPEEGHVYEGCKEAEVEERGGVHTAGRREAGQSEPHWRVLPLPAPSASPTRAPR